jgi:hypothetical protein
LTRKRGALVKSATLVFFEEFNGASRGQKPKKKEKRKEQRVKSKEQGLKKGFKDSRSKGLKYRVRAHK